MCSKSSYSATTRWISNFIAEYVQSLYILSVAYFERVYIRIFMYIAYIYAHTMLFVAHIKEAYGAMLFAAYYTWTTHLIHLPIRRVYNIIGFMYINLSIPCSLAYILREKGFSFFSLIMPLSRSSNRKSVISWDGPPMFQCSPIAKRFLAFIYSSKLRV